MTSRRVSPRNRRAQSVASSFDPRSLSGLQGYYHADDAFWALTTPGGQAGYVPRWPDNSGNVRTLSAASNASSPVMTANQINGNQSIVFASAKLANIKALTAADWKFLHDGSGMTVFALVKAVGTAADHAIVNSTSSTTGTGISLKYDGVNQRFRGLVRNAATQIVTLDQANGGAPVNGVYVVGMTYSETASPKSALYVDGVSVATAASTGAPNAAANDAICLGRLSGAALQFWEGPIHIIVIYNRVLSASEIAQVSAGLRTATTPRSIRHIETVGDSITAATKWQQQLWLRSLASTSRLDRLNFLGTSLAGDIALWTDRQHNGHVGATIALITTDVTGIGALDYTPDVVAVLAGTNDAAADMSAAQTAYATLITTVQAKWPTATVWCIRPPRYLVSAPLKAGMEAFATWIQGTFVPARQALGQRVEYRNGDVNADAEISGDNIHPTDPGYISMGNHIADAEGY